MSIEQALREIIALEDETPTDYTEWKRRWVDAVRQARKALAELDAVEPVAWQNINKPSEFIEHEHLDPMWRFDMRPLYAAPQPASVPQWQPIETVPKNFPLIDVWIARSDGRGVRWADCYYDEITGEWRTTSPSGHLVCVKERAVTHWILPPKEPSK